MSARGTATVPRAPSVEPPRQTTSRVAAPPRRRSAAPRTPVRKRIPRPAGQRRSLGVRLLLAPPTATSSAPRTPFVVLILGLVAGGLVTLLLLNTAVNENSFRLQALQKNQRTLDVKEQELKQKVDQLEAPGTLAAAARRLGLVPAGQPAFIRLPDGRILGVPTPAKGGDSDTPDDGDQSLVPPNTGQTNTGQTSTGQTNTGQNQPATGTTDGGAR